MYSEIFMFFVYKSTIHVIVLYFNVSTILEYHNVSTVSSIFCNTISYQRKVTSLKSKGDYIPYH